jgi:VanZ family protein
MTKALDTEKDNEGWNRTSWMWVVLCAIGIFSTVPIARSFQRFIYHSVGREFFTYIVLFVVGAVLASLLYSFIFKLKVKRISQYVWLFICAGLYVYFIIQLDHNPEEAIHLIEYGLLSYFLFKALSHRIRDWTIYVTAVLFVLFIGTIDEFIQWIVPERYWDFRDVGLNMLSGGIFLLAVWKGIKPKIICMPVKNISVKTFVGIITVNLIFMGLCLSNTPTSVKRYTSIFDKLSWLRSEEPMVEFGYKHKYPEIGTFYSRLSLEELREIDLNNGEAYGKIVRKDINSEETYQELIKTYTPYTNPFLYEFLIHVLRRNNKFEELMEKDNSDVIIKISNTAYRENLLIEKYFTNILKHSELGWSDEKIKDLQKTASLWEENYISKTGIIISSFSMKTAWLLITVILVIVWTSGALWKRRI